MMALVERRASRDHPARPAKKVNGENKVLSDRRVIPDHKVCPERLGLRARRETQGLQGRKVTWDRKDRLDLLELATVVDSRTFISRQQLVSER